MRWAYAHARALVAPSHEDYGLTPLEAGAWGKPTLALRAGGYLDTVAEDVSGLFFDAPTPEAIRAAVVADRGPVLGRRDDPAAHGAVHRGPLRGAAAGRGRWSAPRGVSLRTPAREPTTSR